METETETEAKRQTQLATSRQRLLLRSNQLSWLERMTDQLETETETETERERCSAGANAQTRAEVLRCQKSRLRVSMASLQWLSTPFPEVQ